MKIKKILVPTDFSRYADNALAAALEIAETFDSEVFLVHVIRDGSGFNTLERLDDAMREKVREAVRESTDAALGNQIKKFSLPEKTGASIRTRVARGIPYNEILEFQKEIDPDVLVISTHGRSGFEEFLFGSTAEKIVRRATCSVLVVKD